MITIHVILKMLNLYESDMIHKLWWYRSYWPSAGVRVTYDNQWLLAPVWTCHGITSYTAARWQQQLIYVQRVSTCIPVHGYYACIIHTSVHSVGIFADVLFVYMITMWSNRVYFCHTAHKQIQTTCADINTGYRQQNTDLHTLNIPHDSHITICSQG